MGDSLPRALFNALCRITFFWFIFIRPKSGTCYHAGNEPVTQSNFCLAPVYVNVISVTKFSWCPCMGWNEDVIVLTEWDLTTFI